MPKVTDRTKNIDFQYWLGRYHVTKENIVPTCSATDKMLADGLEKPLKLKRATANKDEV
jgi:hypothetical protein